jgi:hypothetical protein
MRYEPAGQWLVPELPHSSLPACARMGWRKQTTRRTNEQAHSATTKQPHKQPTKSVHEIRTKACVHARTHARARQVRACTHTCKNTHTEARAHARAPAMARGTGSTALRLQRTGHGTGYCVLRCGYGAPAMARGYWEYSVAATAHRPCRASSAAASSVAAGGRGRPAPQLQPISAPCGAMRNTIRCAAGVTVARCVVQRVATRSIARVFASVRSRVCACVRACVQAHARVPA